MRRSLTLLLVTAMIGCVGGVEGADTGPEAAGVFAPPGAVEVRLPHLSPSPVTSPVADPKLPGFDGWPLVFDAAHHATGGRSCVVSLARGAAVLRELAGSSTADACTATWDGRDGSGVAVPPGVVSVSARIVGAAGETLARADATVEVVRLGIDRIQLAPVVDGGRAPLLYRATGGVRGGFYELGPERFPWRLGPDRTEAPEAVALELADGTPRDLPTPWLDVTTPPVDPGSPDGVERDSYNLPTAWIAGAAIEVQATLSADVAGDPGGGAPTMADVRVVAPGGTVALEGDRFAHGATLRFATAASPVPAVGRYDWALEWTFEARAAGGGWVPVPGALVTTHRLYGLVDTPIFGYAAVPHRPWVDVVDLVAGWVDGATADADAVAATIVEGVYFDLGLRYDRERGASFYTDYPGGWEGAVFDLGRFQDRLDGEVINCSDAASIVSTYANMLGVDFGYHILTHEWASAFDLNYIQAIGWEGFTETPFTSGRGAFRYHAVVGPPDGRFFDATLALDGDADPRSLPSTLLLAQGLAPDEYKRRLSSEWMNVRTRVDEKVRVR